MRLWFLSAETSIEHSYFVIPKFALRFVGCWPQKDPRTFVGVVHFLISSLAVAFGAFGECIFGALTLNDLLKSMEAWCPGITKQISLFKMLIFFVHREKLFSLICRIKKLLLADENVEKKIIIQKLAMIASALATMLFVSGNSTNMFFNMIPFMNNIVRIWKGQNTTLDMPFSMFLPDVLTHYPMYPITYVYMTFSGVMTVFTFSGVDGCFVGLCFYISALFKMIQCDIRKAFAQLQAQDKAHAQDNCNVRQELKVIIQRHNEVIDLCNEFTGIFTAIIMGHFFSAALVLCVSVMNLLFNTGVALVLYTFYCFAAVTQLFMYCVGGTYVNDSSLEICDSIYLVEWYKCDVKTRKMVLMIMIRAQKPTSVKVPFFSSSLTAFMSILSTTGSYIALMRSFI